MTDYTWPATVIPANSTLSWMDNTVSFKSPLSGTARTESRPGGRWHLSVTVIGLKHDSVADTKLKLIEAYLYKLNGAEHRAVISDPAYVRSGPGGGIPAVMGAGQTGLTLLTDGWPNSTTVLYAGDRIGIADQMIPVVSDVISGPTGDASISLAHPIRTAPSDNALLNINNPTARYILANKPSFAAAPGIFKTVLVEFEEDIP